MRSVSIGHNTDINEIKPEMNIKLIKKVEILSSSFDMIWEDDNDGGSFDWSKNEIYIGIKSIKDDPVYTFHIISHEILEIILLGMGARFQNGRTRDNFLFSFDHQTFETAMQIHTQILSKFIK